MPSSPRKQKVREEPRVSVNKFAEYLSTNRAGRRDKILQDAKFPPTFQVIRYDEAREIILQFLVAGNWKSQEIQAKIHELNGRQTLNDFDERSRKSNVEALEYFIGMIPTLDLGDSTLTLGAHAPKPFRLNGVDISVRPDLILKGMDQKTGAPVIGAIKFNIGKGAIHSKESGEFVGALLMEYLKDGHGSNAACDYRRCFTLDVFGQKLIPAPKATANRIKECGHASREIARLWPSVEQ